MAVTNETRVIEQQYSEAYIQSKRRKRARDITIKTLTYLFLSLVGATMLIPLIWMVSTSLKEASEIYQFPPVWIPSKIMWSNYVSAWNAQPFGRFYLNSLIVSATTTVGLMSTSSMAAYAFSRLTFPGRDKIFFGYLATMMIPGSVTMIPTFILIKELNLVDTYTGLIVPGLFSAYGTFLLRQFFMTLPRELEEAAKIDGCSLFGIFWRIILPLSKPALATLATMIFMGSWNSFLWPLIITNKTELKTLPIGLQSFQGMYQTDWALLMAASLIVLIPVIIVFLSNQRYFIEGIQLGAVKG